MDGQASQGGIVTRTSSPLGVRGACAIGAALCILLAACHASAAALVAEQIDAQNAPHRVLPWDGSACITDQTIL